MQNAGTWLRRACVKDSFPMSDDIDHEAEADRDSADQLFTEERRGSAQVNALVADMLLKLGMNENKGGWRSLDVIALSHELLVEMVELQRELYFGNYREAQLECADIANYAMMIHDNCRMMIEP